MFDKIITVTLNPSLDMTLWVDKFDFSEPVRCTKERCYPGGKGLNVSRVLTALSIDNIAVGILGIENEKTLEMLLDRENVRYDFLQNDGAIRENLSIVSDENGQNKLLKINRSGFLVTQTNLNLLSDKLIHHMKFADAPLLVFAGSLPKNVTKEQYKALCIKFRSLGAYIALDNDIFTYEDLREIRPFLIKPNLNEIGHMFLKSEITNDEGFEYAQNLAQFTDHVLLSAGEDGLYYASKNLKLLAQVPKVTVLSTIGAGDTALAGFITALSHNMNIENAVKFSASCATASVKLAGTEIITKQNAQEIYSQVDIKHFYS